MNKPIESALPYYRRTREMVARFRDHKASAIVQLVYDLLELNKDISRGVTHKLPIEYISQELGISEPSVYRAIAKLKEIGMFNPTDWGVISGTLPYAQLAKISAQQAKRDKPQRLFYEELRERIVKHESELGEQASKPAIQGMWLNLVKDRKEKDDYFPKASEASRNVLNDLEQYAPLYNGVEV